MMADDDDRGGGGERSAALRSFGRRRGRKLSPTQERLLQSVLPRVSAASVTENDQDDGGVVLSPALAARLASDSEVWIEIGFGGGEHLIWQADANPDVTLIGCEPFIDGVVKVLTAIESGNRTNIVVHDDDARPLLNSLPTARIARAFILFPDPWPKKRHQKRRLINPSFLDSLARVLVPGAEVRFATDIADYARSALIAFTNNPQYIWPARRRSDWALRTDDWPETRYETKAEREGRRSCYFRFERRSHAPAR